MMQPGTSWGGRIAILAGALLFLLLLVLTVRILLVPLVVAMFLAYLFEPGIEVLQRQGMSRSRAYVLIFSVVSVALLLLIAISPSWLKFENVGGSTETLSGRIQDQSANLQKWINSELPMFSSIRVSDKIAEKAAAIAQQLIEQLPYLITSFLINLILVPFIAYFMVRDGRRLRRSIVALVPNRYFEMSLLMFHRIDEQIGGYLRGRLIECMLVTVTQVLAREDCPGQVRPCQHAVRQVCLP